MIQNQETSSFGLQPNIAAGLASLFSWLGGLIILLGKPPQQWVRFVAVQSIVMFVAYIAAIVLLSIISTMLAIVHLGILALLLWPVEMIIFLVFVVAWLIMTVKAFQGQVQRFPFVSELADRWVPASTSI